MVRNLINGTRVLRHDSNVSFFPALSIVLVLIIANAWTESLSELKTMKHHSDINGVLVGRCPGVE